MIRYKGCGLPNVYLANGYQVVETVYGKGITIHDVPGLHQAIGDMLVCAKEPLNGAEFRFLRQELELSQDALGALFGRNGQAIAQWEKGKSKKVDPIGDRLLRLLYRETKSGGLKHVLATLQRIEATPPHPRRIIVRERKDEWKAKAEVQAAA